MLLEFAGLILMLREASGVLHAWSWIQILGTEGQTHSKNHLTAKDFNLKGSKDVELAFLYVSSAERT